MQILGIIGLLVVVVVIGIIFTSSPAVAPENGDTSGYEEVIDSANVAADQLGSNVSLSSKAVFVYEGLSFPDDTRSLDLSGRGLDGSLMAEISQLTELRELNISDNNLTGLPAEVGQLSKLEVLNLANNPLTGLPNELGNLKSLKVLNLRGTQYAEADLNIIVESLPSDTVVLVDK